jgi:hypothetical protein
MFRFGLPAVGLFLLTIGLWQRSRKHPGAGVGYPPPPGFPVNGGYPYQPVPPGPPPPYPLPYPGYPPPSPAPPRRGSSAIVLITIGAIMLALGAAGFLGHLGSAASKTARSSQNTTESSLFRSVTSLEVGQCIDQFSLGTQFLGAGPGDCADVKSTYELAAKGDANATCPDGKRDDSVYYVLTAKSVTMCFALNLKQGQCYMRMEDGKSTRLSPVDCDDTRYAQVQVAERVDGDTPPECVAGVTMIAYPRPARLYCLVPAVS